MTREEEIRLEEVRIIIADWIPDDEFEVMNYADIDSTSLDSRIARNGKKRLLYHLKRYGLTIEDWDLWCNY